MLEITAEDIARLNDEQLRTVVARLSEAELRRRGLSASHLTWGGNQNSADGGIDVRVALPTGALIEGFVPRTATGFQVKAQDMPAGEITDEMRPQGAIRPSIQDLADRSGAYIIVSSQGSTADLFLTNRKNAMRAAVADVRNGNALLVDFYDRTRIATWLRTHQGLIPWVRTLVGRSIPGWQSYGGWAYDPAGLTGEYLIDEKLRLHSAKRESEEGLTALQGIQELRGVLGLARQVVRLVGLSGVGKTRLVQALFDERVGTANLDSTLAVYTNIADEPDPQPIAMASSLVAAGTRAVLVVDNCPAELHHRLSEVCRQEDSRLSVLSVEYDIREDEPEGTEVFTLGSSSAELMEQLVRRRYAMVSQVDARMIAEFSGGNARIALALAATVEHNGTVAGLTDDQLFQRLFQQRHGHDESLYLIAQACALVFSFQGEDISEHDPAELVRLGRLVGKIPSDVYRAVAELKRRDLVQQRGVWRAVLPHAIANRLASTALQNIPYTQIEQQLLTDGAERLMRSFSRRLGYLHTSREAVNIASNWLSVGGLLDDVAGLTDLGRAMFNNIAPAAPEAIVAALERALLPAETDKVAKERKHYFDLLRLLAYDPTLFERAVAVMAKLATADEVTADSHTSQVFASLFHLVLSGTRATVEQRAAVIDSMLRVPDERQRALGVLGLKALLEAWHFLAASGFDFGARSRDFGYWPHSREEVQHWFNCALQLVEKFACTDMPVAPRARAALAEKFRGLWLQSGSREAIVRVCSAIREHIFWPEGWLAVRQALDLDGKGFDADCLAMITALEKTLRPTNLVQRVRAVVFSTRLQGVDLSDYEDHSSEDIGTRMAKTEALARDLGKAVAGEPEILATLLPELVCSDGRLWSFGEGLVEGSADARGLWRQLVDALSATEEGMRKPQVLRGVLRRLHQIDSDLASALLDEAVEHPILGSIYPFVQVAVDLTAQDVARLKRSLVARKAPASMYNSLAYGRATDPIPAPDLRELILGIAALPAGQDAAIEVLHMRLHSEESRKQEPPSELIDAGCSLLQNLTFSRPNAHVDYGLGEVATACLKGDKGAAVVAGLCQRLKNAVARHEAGAYDHDDLLLSLFRAQPVAALHGLCSGDKKQLDLGLRILTDAGVRRHPLELVSRDDLMQWCDQDPHLRYPAMARIIDLSQPGGEGKPRRWTEIAMRFLEKAPAPAGILCQFVSRIASEGGGGGSLATLVDANAALLDQLGALPTLAEVIIELKQQVREWVEEQSRRERAFDRQRDERFE